MFTNLGLENLIKNYILAAVTTWVLHSKVCKGQNVEQKKFILIISNCT
jgi:hypothetical protein